MTAHTFIEGEAETGPAVSPLKPGAPIDSTAAAGQWTLIWHRFAQSKVAVFAGLIVIALYLVGAFAEFLAPSLPDRARPQYTYAPPTKLGLFITNPDGTTRFQLHVAGYTMVVDQESLRRNYTVDDKKAVPIGFFVKGAAVQDVGPDPARHPPDRSAALRRSDVPARHRQARPRRP